MNFRVISAPPPLRGAPKRAFERNEWRRRSNALKRREKAIPQATDHSDSDEGAGDWTSGSGGDSEGDRESESDLPRVSEHYDTPSISTAPSNMMEAEDSTAEIDDALNPKKYSWKFETVET